MVESPPTALAICQCQLELRSVLQMEVNDYFRDEGTPAEKLT